MSDIGSYDIQSSQRGVKNLLLPFLTRNRSIILAILTGVFIRLLIVFLMPDMKLVGDEIAYYQTAGKIITAEKAPLNYFRPPLYIYFCVLVLKSLGDSADAIRIFQCMLEGLTILGVYLVCRRTLGNKAGLWAGWIFALYPDFIAYSHYLWSECLLLFMLVYGILILLELRERPRLCLGVIAGIIWGGLMLLKPYHLYIMPVLLVWFVLSFAKERRWIAVKTAIPILAVSISMAFAWSLHISLARGQATIISKIGEVNLWTGTNYFPPPQFDFPYAKTDIISSREQYAEHLIIRDKSMANLRKEFGRTEGLIPFILKNPKLFMSRAKEKFVCLWAPTSLLLRHIYDPRGHKKYGDPNEMNPILRIGVSYALILSTMVILILAVLGIPLSRERYLLGFMLIYALSYMCMICITPSSSRYRVPLMIFAVVYAGFMLSQRAHFKELLRKPRALIASGIVLVAMGILWSFCVPGIVTAVW